MADSWIGLGGVTADAGSLTGAALEQRILGLMLVHPDHTAETIATEVPITADDFTAPEHEAAFRAITAMLKDGRKPTPLTVAAKIGFETIAGIPAREYWIRVVNDAGTLINFQDYATALRELSARRVLLEAAQMIAEAVSRPPLEITAKEIADQAEASLFTAQGGERAARFVTFAEAAAQAVGAAARAHDRKGGLAGHSTGFRDLDHKLGGLQSSDLLIVAARPGMGKSALAMDIAWSLASTGKPVAFFSLEMSAEQLAMRRLAERTGVSSARLRRGAFTPDEFDLVTRRSREFSDTPLHIDETGQISITQLITKARRLQRRHGLEAVIVDYLQLMTATARRSSDNRVQEITQITGGLKALAKDLNVPVIALSQLSRGVENRPDKRPHLADLRESGSIEQDADVVMFVYREEYYLEREKPTDGAEIVEWQARMEAAAGKAEIIIAKQRHGPLGSVDLHFNAETTSFADLYQHEARL